MSDLTCAVCGDPDTRFTDPATGRGLCRTDRSFVIAGITLEKAEEFVAYLTPAPEQPTE